jgi:predicted AlkP superfamily phosphohydrolase/phosphomutase
VTYSDLIDWSKSRAYMMGAFGCLYVNLKGREPQGIVASGAEYKEVCQLVINGLESLRDEHGCRLIRKVFRKEEVFCGPLLNKAPDLIAIADDPICYLTPNLDDEEIIRENVPWRTGNHDLYGMLAMRGPGVKSGLKLESADIVDVIPTVYMMLNVPIPREVDGRILTECFDEAFLSAHPVSIAEKGEDNKRPEGQGVKGKDDEMVRARLTALGYL